jgi:hypothetical protein
LVDDFDGNGDSALVGNWFFYGDVMGADGMGVTATKAYSAPHSRYFRQTEGQSWGVVLQKDLASVADVRSYSRLEFMWLSMDDDAERTLDINLAFGEGEEGSIYSLKVDLEPSLNQSGGQWTQLSIHLVSASFDIEKFGAFDLSSLDKVEFLIRNNGQSEKILRTVYLDDIKFSGSGDQTPPDLSIIAPAFEGEILRNASSRMMATFEDPSGINLAGFSIKIDGVVLENFELEEDAVSLLPVPPLGGGSHTLEVTVADGAGNLRTETRTFSVDPAYPYPETLRNAGFESGNGIHPTDWIAFGESIRHANSGPMSGAHHMVAQSAKEATGNVGVVQTIAAQLQIAFVDASGEEIPGSVVHSSRMLDHTNTPLGDYRQLVAYATAPANTEGVKLVALFSNNKQSLGSVHFDEAALVQIDPNAIIPYPTELQNPDIEGGNGTVPAGWKTFGENIARHDSGAAAQSGNYTMRAESVSIAHAAVNAGFYQELQAQPGQRWVASVFATASEDLTDGAAAYVQLTFLDENGADIPGSIHYSSTMLDHTSVAALGEYAEFVVDGTAPEGAVGVKMVGLFSQAKASTGVVHFDEAALVQIDPDTITPYPTELRNPGMESGSGPIPAGWKTFGENIVRHELDNANDGRMSCGRSGFYAMRAEASDEPANSGFYQVIQAQPGQRWRATVQAANDEPLTDGAAAFVQLIFVDAQGYAIQGSSHYSNIRDHTNNGLAQSFLQILREYRFPESIINYLAESYLWFYPLQVEGTAPENTVGVEMVVNFSQAKASSGGRSLRRRQSGANRSGKHPPLTRRTEKYQS